VPQVISAARKYQFATKATYILVGGLGGLGRSIAQWMVDNGARNIVFLSRSGVQKPEAQQLVEALKRTGVRVTVYACDVGNRDHLETVIQECTRDLPPIRGVIQGAMDLRVSQFESLCLSSFSID